MINVSVNVNCTVAMQSEGEGDAELKEGTEQGGVNQRKPTS